MKNRIGKLTRLALIVCGLGLIVVLFVPLWTIDLVAPQYPEGLVLVINPDGLAGNVDIINGLNHYIGMKTLHNEDFIEFKILPWLIAGFAALFFIVALIGRKKALYALLVAYMVFGVVAMADFYKWEYDYGHNLDPNAAIKVPGMAYQPPLIGYKQLLNFSAYSLPATGGWIFLGVGAATLVFSVLEYRKGRKGAAARTAVAATAMAFSFTLISCSTGPEAIRFGTDNCHSCKMTISDQRFGAELVTKKGKVYKFDDSYCLVAFLKSKAVAESQTGNIYLVDFAGNGKLINATTAFLYKSEELRSPMGGDVAAFSSKEQLQAVSKKYPGNETSWKQLYK